MNKEEYFKKDNKDGRKCREKWLYTHNNEMYNEVIKHCDINHIETTKFVEKVWYYINNINETLKCHCGNYLKFDDLGKGFRKNCSLKCSGTSLDRKNKMKQTCINTYGVEYPAQNEDVKLKAKKTLIKNYGVEHPLQSNEIREKAKQTTLKNYGVEHPLQSNKIREKALQTTFDNHGVKFILQSEYFLNKAKSTTFERFGKEHYKQSDYFKKISIENIMANIPNYSLIDNDSSEATIKCPNEHIFEIDIKFLNKRIYKDYEPCTICNPYNSYSDNEKKISSFLKNENIEVVQNSRKIIPNKELDIFLPEKNIAIEYNGLYWHSDEYKSDDYHLIKTERCEQKNIKLIHIFEDEWIFKEDIVKSRLLNLAGKTPNRIYARKCIIKNVSVKESRLFLDKNHIQGYVNANHILGLYYNGELVSLMTFGKKRKNLGSKHKYGHFELLRFCNKLHTNVIGGASKLFKYFISKNYYESIISYTDRRWSQGDLYHSLGFEKIGKSKPNYFYTKGLIRENRFKYRKSELIKDGFDGTQTEREIMKQRGFNRIYDCGTYKFEYLKNKKEDI